MLFLTSYNSETENSLDQRNGIELRIGTEFGEKLG